MRGDCVAIRDGFKAIGDGRISKRYRLPTHVRADGASSPSTFSFIRYPLQGELIVNMCKRSLQGFDRRVWETGMEVLVWSQVHSEEQHPPAHVSQHPLCQADPDGKCKRGFFKWGLLPASFLRQQLNWVALMKYMYRREMASIPGYIDVKDKIGRVVIRDGTTNANERTD
jgi:hypothetical protein